jgi:hypothetical protein
MFKEALGLMQSTHFQTLEVIGGVPPLRLRFSMLNHKYFFSPFSTGGHPLQRLLVMLSRLNSTKMVAEFDRLEITIRNQSAWFTIACLRRFYTCSYVLNVYGGAGADFCWKRFLPNGGALDGGIGDVGT